MAIHRKVFRFRMKPTAEQSGRMRQFAGARRWVWNWALARCREHYADRSETLSPLALSAELTGLKQQPDTAWLADMDSQALQQTLADLRRAYANFFAGRANRPKFKSKRSDTQRFRIPQRVKVIDGRVYVPKIGWIKIRQSREIDGQTKSATFACEPDGHWYVSIVAEFDMPDTPLPEPKPEQTVGVDLGLKEFAVTSDGERTASPKFYRKAERKLRRAQRVKSRRQKGSKRCQKARLKVAKIHQKIARQRNDFIHKFTTELVRRHDAVCIEDLSLKGLVRTKLAKSVSDAGLGAVRRQLTYKCEWNRTHLAVISRWFPSSKMCHACGQNNDNLTLADRQWTCVCGTVLDRDLNAAINIRDEGLRILAEGHSDSLNARGAGVRPPREAVGVEARIP
jgi:putative transposase